MKPKQFLNILTEHKWRLKDNVYYGIDIGALIRDEYGFCPIIKINNIINENKLVSNGQYLTAAKNIGLDQNFAIRFIYAADNTGQPNRKVASLRKYLMKQLGL
jgi:hypothetical protein